MAPSHGDNLKMSKIAIMGFGNTVRSDGAIGCYVIDELTAFFMTSRSVTLFDMGSSSSEIMYRLKGHDYVILVDGTTDSGQAPGTIIRLPDSETQSLPREDSSMYLHSLNWNQALTYGQKVLQEDFPKRIDVYLIAINNTQIEGELSEEVKKAGDEVVKQIRRSIAEVEY